MKFYMAYQVKLVHDAGGHKTYRKNFEIVEDDWGMKKVQKIRDRYAKEDNVVGHGICEVTSHTIMGAGDDIAKVDYKKEVIGVYRELFFRDWMTEEDFDVFLSITLNVIGTTIEKEVDKVLIGIGNGYSFESQKHLIIKSMGALTDDPSKEEFEELKEVQAELEKLKTI